MKKILMIFSFFIAALINAAQPTPPKYKRLRPTADDSITKMLIQLVSNERLIPYYMKISTTSYDDRSKVGIHCTLTMPDSPFRERNSFAGQIKNRALSEYVRVKPRLKARVLIEEEDYVKALQDHFDSKEFIPLEKSCLVIRTDKTEFHLIAQCNMSDYRKITRQQNLPEKKS
jgi:hypothetical protein